MTSLDQIADEIGAYCRKWGRIQVTQTKSKFSQVRVYCTLGMLDLHGLIYPGYHYNQFPEWFRTLSYWLTNWFFDAVAPLTYKYQVFIYKRAYFKAIKKYPQYRKNILQGADYYELLNKNNELCTKKLDKVK